MNPRPHEKSTRMFAHLAERFDVAVDTLDYDKWSAALTMAKALDNLVDDDHIYDSSLYSARVMRGESIPYLEDEEVAFVRDTYEQLSERSQEQWRESATRLGEFAIKRLEAETIHDYLDAVREESPLLANVLLVENSVQRTDQQPREVFNEWLGQAVRSMYVFDTCSDFVKDHNEGNMNIPVTPSAVRELVRSSVKEGVNLLRVTPLSVYPVFAHRSFTKLQEKTVEAGFWSNQFVWKKSESSR